MSRDDGMAYIVEILKNKNASGWAHHRHIKPGQGNCFEQAYHISISNPAYREYAWGPEVRLPESSYSPFHRLILSASAEEWWSASVHRFIIRIHNHRSTPMGVASFWYFFMFFWSTSCVIAWLCIKHDAQNENKFCIALRSVSQRCRIGTVYRTTLFILYYNVSPTCACLL